mmetsp:Transcript_26994/g.44504  ORF Transcript_26994/g.44504 Transcript_26994/m.44504 type:complete len:578 (-) Transcript_26994:205-1938(-)
MDTMMPVMHKALLKPTVPVVPELSVKVYFVADDGNSICAHTALRFADDCLLCRDSRAAALDSENVAADLDGKIIIIFVSSESNNASEQNPGAAFLEAVRAREAPFEEEGTKFALVAFNNASLPLCTEIECELERLGAARLLNTHLVDTASPADLQQGLLDWTRDLQQVLQALLRRLVDRQQVFLCRSQDPQEVYQIFSQEVFTPMPLQHGSITRGYMLMGYIMRKMEGDSLFEAPPENQVERVAIKMLRLDVIDWELTNIPHFQENPYIEAYWMQTIGDNIHVLGCYDVLYDDRFLYIVMPWCDGGSLCDHSTGSLPLNVARNYFTQMMENLEYLHERHGVYHGDIKPANCMLRNGCVVFTDLAMSRRIPADGLVENPGGFGTIAYMLPEALGGRRYDPTQHDVWGCKVILWNLVSGMNLYHRPDDSDILFRYMIEAGALSPDFYNERVQAIENQVRDEVQTLTDRLDEAVNLFQAAFHELILHESQQHDIQDAAKEQARAFLVQQFATRRAECIRLDSLLTNATNVQTVLGHVQERISIIRDDLLELFELSFALDPQQRITRQRTMTSRFMTTNDV